MADGQPGPSQQDTSNGDQQIVKAERKQGTNQAEDIKSKLTQTRHQGTLRLLGDTACCAVQRGSQHTAGVLEISADATQNSINS